MEVESSRANDAKDSKKGKISVEAEKIWKAYLKLLKERPLLTKSVSSGVIAAVGDIIAQKIVLRDSSPLTVRQTGAFAILGLCYSGPLAHYFYSWLDQFIPKDVSYYAIKRIIADRFVIAPPYLLVFFYLLGLLEGIGHTASVDKIRTTFWTALKMNWKIWTVLQFINLNYVPIQFRVLFQSCIAFVWTICLAVYRRSATD
ncbi:peroxisomal membrane protein 2-like [Apostichopus japonicus]|uniref:peroxisomal membrane protein 2-like n=1 Tax=Stichopus japonicus TaxID=307972 RepID=UPI003AB3A93F